MGRRRALNSQSALWAILQYNNDSLQPLARPLTPNSTTFHHVSRPKFTQGYQQGPPRPQQAAYRGNEDKRRRQGPTRLCDDQAHRGPQYALSRPFFFICLIRMSIRSQPSPTPSSPSRTPLTLATASLLPPTQFALLIRESRSSKLSPSGLCSPASQAALEVISTGCMVISVAARVLLLRRSRRISTNAES